MYVLFILFIYLIALCYICFCLLILLISLFAVVDVVVVYSFFSSFYCSCSGFSIYFTFLLVISTLLLCCHCVLEPCCPFAIVALYVFLLLLSLLTHGSSKSYCHRCLYDLALVLLVWLLILLVYNFPYGDFMVN